ncbi:murein L,D-transpeptidase [compost metagenome]
MRVLRSFKVLFLTGTFLFQIESFAQLQSNKNNNALEHTALADYTSIVDQFSPADIRRSALESWKHGLNPKNYWSDGLESAYQRGATNRDVKLRSHQAFLRLLQDLYGGRVNPQSVGSDIKLIKKPFLTPKQLQTLALTSGKNTEALLANVEPKNSPYQSVKEAMRKIYPNCTNGTWVDIIPLKTPLRWGTRNKTIVDIKKRLALMGYAMSSMDDLFDNEVLNAVSDIQWNLRIRPDGEISPGGKVWSYLSVPCLERVRQLQADMEKMRWFPQYFEDRYIFVNLAMSYFLLIDNSPGQNTSMVFRTVNGRTERKSPTLRDEIVMVIFNPYWVVPPTIFTQDKVADLKNLSPAEITKYFTSHNYEVWNSSFTRQVDPATIDWLGISQGAVSPNIYIRQKPHLGNALGVVKFELTNSFSIYLHDTNQRELFNEPQRQLSSGCVRLEKPFDLAEYLLQETPWDRAAIDTVVARPGEIISKPTEVSLEKKKRMPVYMAYLTSQASADGIVRFVDDAYGQNAAIGKFLPGAL